MFSLGELLKNRQGIKGVLVNWHSWGWLVINNHGAVQSVDPSDTNIGSRQPGNDEYWYSQGSQYALYELLMTHCSWTSALPIFSSASSSASCFSLLSVTVDL